jgi:TIR domain
LEPEEHDEAVPAMVASVAARLGLQGRFTEHSFRLSDLAATIHAFTPERFELAFHVSVTGESTLFLECEFDPGPGLTDAQGRAELLKENLFRADVAGRLDCLFTDGSAAGFAEVTSLSVQSPADAALQSGRWVALPLPLLDAAVDLFQHAQSNGFELGYRIRLHTRDGDAALARRLVPAAAELSARGHRPDLERALRETIGIVSDDGWTALESFFLPPTGGSRTWVEKLVHRRLEAAMRFFPKDYWTMQWDGEPQQGASADVQQARDASYPDRVLETIVPSQADSPLPMAVSRPTPSVEGNYVFVSYAHADRDYGLRLIDLLSASGVRVWWDKGIEAGTVWDEELERRVRDAGAVVVCLTARYEQSRYCTRELKFADLKGKRILPIAPKPWTWGEGLQLMFQELQVSVFEDGKGFPAFRDALRAAAPSVFADAPEGVPTSSGPT